MVPGVKEERKTQPTVEKPAMKRLRSRLTWKTLLYHPLTWLAIGAHIVLLVVPFNPDKPAAVEPEEPEEEIDESIPVDILNLSALSAPQPPPDAPEPATPPPPAPTAAPPPPSAPPPPAASSVPEPAAPVAPEPATPEPASPVAPEPATPAYSPGGDQNAFTGNLGNLGLNSYTFLPDAGMFPSGNGDRFLDLSDPNTPGPLPGSLGAQWNDKQPGDVLGVMQDAYAGSGLIFTEWTPYEGEQVYQLSNPDGNPFMYVSVVNMNGSSLLVMWPDDPSL